MMKAGKWVGSLRNCGSPRKNRPRVDLAMDGHGCTRIKINCPDPCPSVSIRGLSGFGGGARVIRRMKKDWPLRDADKRGYPAWSFSGGIRELSEQRGFKKGIQVSGGDLRAAEWPRIGDPPPEHYRAWRLAPPTRGTAVRPNELREEPPAQRSKSSHGTPPTARPSTFDSPSNPGRSRSGPG
jgi:hypothetical protein